MTERLKEALFIADRKRHNNTNGNSLDDFGPKAPEPISYTHTRSSEVNRQSLRKRHIVNGFETNTFTDSFKILRTRVLQHLQKNQLHTVAITSPGVGEGKTITAINLAISLSLEMKHTVLLVDADMRNPGLKTSFEIAETKGLADYLTEDTPLCDLLVHPTGFDNLVLLPAGDPNPKSAEILSSRKMSLLVEEMKDRYPTRIILFDLPPLLISADALAFLPCVEASLLVLEDRHTLATDARNAMEILQGEKAHVIGTVLNKSRYARKG